LSIDEEELGAALRIHLHELASGYPLRGDVIAEVLRRDDRHRRRVRLVGAASAVMLASIALPLSLSAGNSQPRTSRGVELRLASYSMRLPTGFRRVSSTTSPCRANDLPFALTPIPGALPSSTDQPGIVSAADGADGCVSMLITPPYAAASAPTDGPMLLGDGFQPVQVGSYQAWIASEPAFGPGWQGIVVALDVRLPAADSQDQEFMIYAVGLSQAQLISIVSTGLSTSAAGAGG
jgi:hypothetical protein